MTPGVLALIDTPSIGLSSPFRRSTRPFSPKEGIGFPVFLSSAQRLLRCVAKTRSW